MKSLKILHLLAVVGLASCENNDSPEAKNTILFTSNNSNGNLVYFNLTGMSNNAMTIATSSTAADGVFYNKSDATLYQVSRSAKQIEGYAEISKLMDGASVSPSISGPASMQSPREMAVSGDLFVVADNQDVDGDASTPDGRLYVFTKSATGFTLRNTLTTDIKLWGIAFIGNDLYAVSDGGSKLAVYTNFMANNSDAKIPVSKTVVVEGIVRTHGIAYDESSNTMVLTDIGSAANTQDDGGFQIVSNFTTKFNAVQNNGTLAASDMIRVSGASTLMGNPVDVAYDGNTKTVYIAEAGNGGGRILSFENIGTGGNLTPIMNKDLGAASAVFLFKGNL